MNEIILDLGCGNRKYANAIGIDRIPIPCVDIVSDLNNKLPVKDNSVDLIYSYHFLEHANDIVFIVEEIYRVAKPNAIIKIRVPYFMCFDAFTDPTHRNFFTERAFDYFSDEIYFNYYSKAKFKILKKNLIINPTLKNKILSIFIPKRYLKAIFDVFNEIEFELKVIK